MKRVFLLFLAAPFVLLAQDKAGDEAHGIYKYDDFENPQVCKSCHFRDNKKGAPFLWSESKSSRAWNRVFAKRYPDCAKDGSWSAMNLDQQLKLNDYLYRFARDSQDISDNT